MSDSKKPFWAKCSDCGHIWTCAYTPMGLAMMGELLGKLCCPMCGTDSKRITPAKQDNGILTEAKP